MKKKVVKKKKRYSNKRIPDEVLFKIALRYYKVEDFIREERSKYTLLSKRKLLASACAHMTKKDITGENHPNFKHTTKSLAKKAGRCKNSKEFSKKYPSEFVTAHNRGVYKEITTHFVESNPAGDNNSHTKHTYKKLSKLALSCGTYPEFREKYFNEYMAAYRKGILDKICSHMPDPIGENHPNTKYKNSEIIEKGSQYRTPYQFFQNDPNAFKIAWKRKLLDKIPFPDGTYVNSSAMEKELFDIVNNIVGNAKKLRDNKVKIEDKPFIRGFHVDIFVPGLNLGIEVDGTWWHSFECMRKQKGKKLWSDEDVRNYHEIKDAWFATKGITILHIKEEEWLEDKQACIDKCLTFLGIEQKKVA